MIYNIFSLTIKLLQFSGKKEGDSRFISTNCIQTRDVELCYRYKVIISVLTVCKTPSL